VNTNVGNDEPEISVVLCTHNGEEWLEAQLDSILSQTRPPDELIVGDDESCDSTFGLLQSFARRAEFPVHIARHEPQLGVVDNFEVTLSRANGRYMALCDQDDVWLPDRIESGVEAVASIEGDGSVPALVFSDLILIDEHDQEGGRSFMETRGIDGRPDNPLGTLLRHNLVTGCTVTCNRALLKKAIPFPDQIVMHDWWLALVAAAIGRIEMLESPKVRYRLHGKNQVGAQSLVGWEGIRRIMPGVESRKALARVFRQDQELGRRLGDQLDPSIRSFIECIPRGGGPLRRAARAAGVSPQGFARRVRFFLETLIGGYRRYLD
tara:strand:+ start:1357 stop:2322 length:966 start_codon:yes stop_codon:yes gene_type:complete